MCALRVGWAAGWLSSVCLCTDWAPRSSWWWRGWWRFYWCSCPLSATPRRHPGGTSGRGNPAGRGYLEEENTTQSQIHTTADVLRCAKTLLQTHAKQRNVANQQPATDTWAQTDQYSLYMSKWRLCGICHLIHHPSPRVLPLLKTYASTAKVYKTWRVIGAQAQQEYQQQAITPSQISVTCMTHWWCICSSNFSRNRKGNDYLNQHFFHWTDRKKQTETSWLQPWADQEEITAWARLFKHLKQLYNSICLLKNIGIMMQKEGCREGVRMHGKTDEAHHWYKAYDPFILLGHQILRNQSLGYT